MEPAHGGCIDTKKASRGRPSFARDVVQFWLCLLSSAGHVALLEAAGADVHLLGTAVLEDGDTLDVGLELAVHGAVGVADGTTSNGVLAADIAYLRHDSDLHRAAPVALGADNLQKPNYFSTPRAACKRLAQVLVAVL